MVAIPHHASECLKTVHCSRPGFWAEWRELVDSCRLAKNTAAYPGNDRNRPTVAFP